MRASRWEMSHASGVKIDLGRMGVWFELADVASWPLGSLGLHRHHLPLSGQVRLITPPFLCFCNSTSASRLRRAVNTRPYFQDSPTLPVCASYHAGSPSLISRIAND